MIKEYNWFEHPLKHCPFCAAKAKRTGGSLGGVVIKSCRCSNDECIASRCSIDYDVWNSRPSAKESNRTTRAVFDWGVAVDK